MSMDYMLDLPSTKLHNDYVFMVVNWFPKETTLTPYKKSIIEKYATNIFCKSVLVHLGYPTPLFQIVITCYLVLFGPVYG
jgi:hypothetical protein